MKQFRILAPTTNTLTLHQDYIFAYAAFDGFSARLLRGEFLVDHHYNYTLELNAFQHQDKTHNHSNTFLETGQVQGQELAWIEKLLLADWESLEASYDDKSPEMTDVGSQQVFINFCGHNRCIHIVEAPNPSCFESPAEQILMALDAHFKEWIEQKYRDWLS